MLRTSSVRSAKRCALAFWKAKVNEADEAGAGTASGHCETMGEGRNRAKVGVVSTWEAREGCRGAGRGKEIAQNFLPFLDGLW